MKNKFIEVKFECLNQETGFSLLQREFKLE